VSRWNNKDGEQIDDKPKGSSLFDWWPRKNRVLLEREEGEVKRGRRTVSGTIRECTRRSRKEHET